MSPSKLGSASPLLARAWASSWGDLGLSLALFFGALLLRLPYLHLIPPFGAEVEIWRQDVLPIYRGEAYPLASTFDPYNSAFFAYLVALAFWALGPSIFLPRLVVTVLASATVVTTYWLVRPLGGRSGGALAGLLLATSAPAIVYLDRNGAPGHLAPFFVTAALLAFATALRRSNGPLLALSGLLAGLAVNTHPLVLTILPGLGVVFLTHPDLKAWLRRPWPYLALGLLVISYAPMLYYNLTTDLGSLQALRTNYTYVFETNPSPATWVKNLYNLSRTLGQGMGSDLNFNFGWEYEDPPPPWPFVAYLLLLPASLAYAWRRGGSLLLAVIVSSLAGMALFTHAYPIRYLAHLFPLGYAAVGLMVTALLRRLPALRWRFAAVGVVSLSLLFWPLVSLNSYYQQQAALGYTNQALLDDLARLKGQGLPIILVDDGGRWYAGELQGCWDPTQALPIIKAFDGLLAVEGTPYQRLWPGDARAALLTQVGISGAVALMVPDGAQSHLSLPLTRLSLESPQRCWGIYLWEPL